MKKLLAIAATAAIGLATIAAQAETRQEKGESQLAKMLEGFRESGEAKACITAMRANRLTVIPYVGVAYDDGDTIYVARVVDPDMLSDYEVPVFERLGSQLCKTDVLRAFDRNNPNFSSVVFLKDFVPYTRVEKASGN